ncbi:SIMPL domain-containing protein [Prevotella aurantiaca]|jgi:hypothetical protein|uniref:SIMPL domain-containing protein n=1 Tax=Prevotella aurantiaca TaxID=596085 RepID=UPI001CB4CC21|nr:SIMPL domain-containing protein [Prevotella aurantiaca]MBF1386301.1 SIMPL domain-containing protein [Prevotella aurantiaca]
MKIEQKEIVKVALGIIIGAAAVASCWQIGRGLQNFRRGENKIQVTGMAEKQITSDLIVWNLTVKGSSFSKTEAYNEFNNSIKQVKQFFINNNIPDSCLEMSSVSINKQTRSEYSSKEERYIEIDEGYAVTQNITISSHDLPIVEKAYQKISSLYERGVDFNSNDLLYYYTKLNDLKMELLNNASIDAYKRAETIAKGCNASVGSLQTSSMGVFQIVGLNSSEDYSWGGTFNTTDKEKKASITIRATYSPR